MTDPADVEISTREAEVLALLAQRHTNAEIAARLFISVRTVESHVSSLLRKCDVADRRALSALAAERAGTARTSGTVAAMPVSRTTFVGRRREQESALAVLTSARLTTLVGAGGVGKTRLAAELARRLAADFPAGGVFVDLTPVRDGFVAQAAATALGVTPGPRQSPLEAVANRLGNDRALVVLDNCEHLLDAVATFAERVLSGCPEVTVLATSRERIGLPDERVVLVPPLSDPDGRALFQDRAIAADPGFAADPAVVGELCARLDGLPLAIELAAARSASLGVDGLRAALADPLRLLTGRRPADQRHRSLRAVLGWSYGLLEDAEQALFRRLAVFTGGFDLDSARTVTMVGDRATTAHLLGRLVDKNLLTNQHDPARWRMLGTVRAYARELLDTDEIRGEVVGRYLTWAADLAVDLAARVTGQWRAEFDLVAADLRAALLNSPPGRDPVTHRLARSLGRLAYARRFLDDALLYYRQAADRAPDPGAAARDLLDAANCAQIGTTPGPRVVDLLLAAAERAGAAGDGNRRALALARIVEVVNRFDGRIASDLSAEYLDGLLDDARAAGDPDDSAVRAGIALAAAWHSGRGRFAPDPAAAGPALAAARATGDPVLISAGLDLLGSVAALGGRRQEERRISRERWGLLPLLDRDNPQAAPEIEDIFHVATTNAFSVGDLTTALEVARAKVDDDLLGHRSFYSLGAIVPALLMVGELTESLRHAEELWAGWQRAGRPATGVVVRGLAFGAQACGLLGDLAGLTRWRARLAEVPVAAGVDVRRLASVIFAEARVAVHLGAVADAAELVGRAEEFSAYQFQPYARAAAAELAVVAGLPDAAERVAATEAVTADNAWAAACLARARGRLSGDESAFADAIARWERIGAWFERACTIALLPERVQ